MPKIKLVRQAEPFGCGIACIAMIAGKDYWQVRQIAPSDLMATREGINIDAMLWLLSYYGFHCRLLYISNHIEEWPVLDSPFNILLTFVKGHNHWILHEDKKGNIYDPNRPGIQKLSDYRTPSHIIGVI